MLSDPQDAESAEELRGNCGHPRGRRPGIRFPAAPPTLRCPRVYAVPAAVPRPPPPVPARARPLMDADARATLAAHTVGAAQRRLPADLRTLARGVQVHYHAAPAPDVLREGFPPDLLGLFTGTAHGTELAEANPTPPQIVLYLDNLWDYAGGDPEAFSEEVHVTYLHELGHFFGWDEEDLAARGLD